MGRIEDRLQQSRRRDMHITEASRRTAEVSGRVAPDEAARWRVFIGSSSEQIACAHALEENLAADFDLNLWTNLAKLGRTVPEILTEAKRTNDFAIIILTSDDITVSRDEAERAPRDNLVFELGWFMSAFGPRRTFFVVEQGVVTKIPSDLRGMIYATFRRREPLNAAMGAASSQLRRAILEDAPGSIDLMLVEERSLRRSVSELSRVLDSHDFVPDLIVGVSRGGLAAAGLLAQDLGDYPIRPILSILPDNDFRNDFNSFAVTRSSFLGVTELRVKVLVVDDVSRSGRTLEAARAYMIGTLGVQEFDVRTAAMTQYEGEYARRSEPDYVINRVDYPIEVMGHLEPFGS